MPRPPYPAGWENLAIFFGRVKRASKLPAADLAKRLGDDGGRFELQSLVLLGGGVSSWRVDKIEACDCGGLWIVTWLGWHQASDFEIRYRPPPHKLRYVLTLPLADETPVADDKPLTSRQRAARRKAEKDEAKALAAKQEATAADFILDHAGTWLQPGMGKRCQAMCKTDLGVGHQGYRRVKKIVKTRLEQLAEAAAKRR